MSEYNIQMNKYNALNAEYDQLYPATKIENVDGLNTALQNKLGGIESTEYPGCYYRMVSGVVEWFNPPMALGVEYRTTERCNGKPVYTKLVDCGAGPNATRKSVDAGISNVDRAVSANGSWGSSSIPYEWFSGDGSGAQAITITLNGATIEIASTVNYSERTIYALIKYTKTND